MEADTYFLDFDGTIVDVWERYYQVFCKASNCQTVSKEVYIRNKRRFEKDSLLADALHVSLPDDYYSTKKKLLECEEYLQTDVLIAKKPLLLSFFRERNCKILTMRRSEEMFYQQLEYLGLSELRNNCVVLNPDKKISKADYLLSLESELIVLVGDSESEYNAVKNGNVQVVMVSTGLRCSSHFAPTKKLLVINDINDFLTSFKEKK